jgi:hypothetical protein
MLLLNTFEQWLARAQDDREEEEVVLIGKAEVGELLDHMGAAVGQ